MTLWDKGMKADKAVAKFTVGNDYELDYKLVKYDCLASAAHVNMLTKIGVFKKNEQKKLVDALNEIIDLAEKGKFEIKQEDEDCHTAIEKYLVKKLGNTGKKIHTARSRNDQVLTAMRLYEKAEIEVVFSLTKKLSYALKKKSDKTPMPGYTHMRKAMPATVGMWLGSYIAVLDDSEEFLDEVHEIIDKSPLGSAAGFGVPVFDIDNEMTAKELGFDGVINNPMYAQLSRGKVEGMLLSALSSVMLDLNRLATDLAMFSMDEFGYVSLPDKLCTGSSIMPQKKNPDVLELVRAQYHVVLGEQFKVQSMTANLMSGYNRDIQLTKKPVMNSFDITKACLNIMTHMIGGMKINKSACKKAMTKELYATEEAYKLVKKGMSFRDAYKKIGKTF